MKLIPLTRGYFAQVSDEDFEWLSQWKWNANINGNHVYAVRSYRESGKYVTVFMHRQIMGVTDRHIKIDHRIGDGRNNMRENLRTCTHKQNLMNRGGNPNTSSIFKGVSLRRDYNKWVAYITNNGKRITIGQFESEEEAARQFNFAARMHHGEFAKYNDVSPMFPDNEWGPAVLTSKNTSGFRGVSFENKTGKWSVQINKNKKQIRLGTFYDPIEAARAYDSKARELHGDHARLNFPETKFG